MLHVAAVQFTDTWLLVARHLFVPQGVDYIDLYYLHRKARVWALKRGAALA